MLTHSSAFMAIAKLLEEATELTTYVGLSTQGHKRPSLWLQQGKATRERVGHSLYQHTSTLIIQCDPREDSKREIKIEDAFAMMEQVLLVFESGAVSVLDRHLHAEAAIGGIDLEKAWVQLTMSWTDSPDEVKLPNMDEVYIKKEGI